ncbi:MAG: hypothetical protein INH41_14300 [Myxococcaceae bacterium]|jgi:hypothetical protein|nr:hypothetical protein [Myxococcaceae bacterium]MCA3013550.1 hypothetical protein [Myxococcaceae bacterium]
MGSRRQASAETKFLRGETGVDGAATKEQVDPAQAEQAKASEALYRGRTWLGRECLTWVLFASNDTRPIATLDDEPISVLFNGRLTLRAASGDVTEVTAKGVNAPYAGLIRQAADLGLLVHSARLSLTWQERVYEVTLDAEHFDVRAGKTPELLKEDESEKLAERLDHVATLGRLIDAVVSRFIALRTSPRWKKTIVPELKAWMREHGPASAATPTGRR